MKTFSLLICAITFSTSSSAADIGNGSELHLESCTRCHDSAIYTRADRKVQNLPTWELRFGSVKTISE